jgi:hypothetical protein
LGQAVSRLRESVARGLGRVYGWCYHGAHRERREPGEELDAGGRAWPRCAIPAVRLLVMTMVTVLTAATLGLLGAIAGWGVRRAVEPAA